LKPKKCSVQNYIKKLEISGKVQKDLLGFTCSFEYLVNEIKFRNSQLELINNRDLEWVEYLKSIGGPENLKPAGVFKPSKDLKAIVRRGVPVAYRAVVWHKISLSYLNKIKYPEKYYETLLSKANELNFRVRDDIEKDVARCFFFFFSRNWIFMISFLLK
jgi:hypothetical protein